MGTWQPGYVVSVRETGTNKGSLGSASFSRDQSGGSARSRNEHTWKEGCREIDQKRLKTHPFRKIYSCVFWSSFEPIVINLKPNYQRRR